MRVKGLYLWVIIWSLLFIMPSTGWALPKGIIKGRMEVTQQLREKNVYGMDIYRGIFQYNHKKSATGLVIPMITVYNKAKQVILEGFTYLDFREVRLVKGAYIQFFVYTPHVEDYHHHEIELYLVDESNVTNYDTVVATQALFAKDIAEQRRTKNTASEKQLELLNKHRRNLKPPMKPELIIRQSTNNPGKSRGTKKNSNSIDWNSPLTYGFKWGGFGKDDNFLRY